MLRVSTRTLALVLLAALVRPGAIGPAAQDRAPPAGAQEKRFDPELHFPAASWLYVAAGDLSDLATRLRGTLWGRMVAHPGWREAFAGPLAMASGALESQLAEIRETTGMDLRELAGIFRGGVALTLRGLGPSGFPDVGLAVELGETRAEILGLVERLETVFRSAGGEVSRRPVGGVEATSWMTPFGPVLHGVLGGHLFVTNSADLLLAIDGAYRGGGAPPLRDGPVHQELAAALDVPDRQLLVELDLAALREALLSMVPNEEDLEETRRVLALAGADRLTSLGFALGFEDGATRSAVRLGMRDGSGGFLEVLQSGHNPCGEVDAALERIPAAATRLSVVGMAPGRFFTRLDKLLRASIPELGVELDELYGDLEELSGLSFEDDLSKLPPIEVFGFKVKPPAGGLLSDSLLLARTEAVDPYWKVVEKLAASFGSAPRTLTAGGATIRYVNLAGELGGGLDAFADIFADGEWTEKDLLGLAGVLALLGSTYAARFDRDDGWSIVSSFPQAVRRYAAHHLKAPAAASRDDLAALARRALSGASAAEVAECGQTVLWLYNTLLAVANNFSGLAAQAGIDLARLPPAEEFLDATGLGYVRLSFGPEGWTVEARRGLESLDPLVVAAAGGLVAGLVTPVLLRGREEARKVQCTNNLKQLYTAMADYDSQRFAFPSGAEGSAAGFQALLATRFGAGLTPDLFVCPASSQSVAETDGRGKFRLDEHTLSYELAPWKTRPNRQGMLAWDKEPHHGGMRMVLFTDSSVREIDEEEFQELLEEERAAGR